jgi:ribosome-associated protein
MNFEEKKLNQKIKLIITAIENKGGSEIVSINLKSIENSPCDFFLICTGNSNRQIQAIAKGIEEKTLEELEIKAWQKEGLNSDWILLDYIDIVVHVFKPETRDFYDLVSLWGDADIKTIKTIKN